MLVSGVDLVESRGRTLQVGEVAIRINGETRPCRLMEESHRPGSVRQLKFEPATLDGEPVDIYYNITINWKLEK